MRRPLSWIVALLVVLPLAWAAMPVQAAETVTVTIDKMRILRLKQDASIVVVARPDVVNVVLESPRILFVYGLSPGETSLHILDAEQKEVMVADVVVATKTARQVNVHRGATESTLSCAPNCMRVATPAGGGGAAPAAAPTTGGATAAAAGAATPSAPTAPAPTTPAPGTPAPTTPSAPGTAPR